MPCSEILRQVIGPPSQISNKLKFPMRTSKLRLHQRSESSLRRQVPYRKSDEEAHEEAVKEALDKQAR